MAQTPGPPVACVRTTALKRSGSDECLNKKRAERVASRREAVFELGRSMIVPPLQTKIMSHQVSETDSVQQLDTARRVILDMNGMSAEERQRLKELSNIIAVKLVVPN